MKNYLKKLSVTTLLLPILSFAMQDTTTSTTQGSTTKGTWDANDFPTGFYIAGNVGYVSNDWKTNASPIGGRSATYVSGPDWKNGSGALSAGGCFGYQIRQDFGVELGGFWFDSASVNTTLAAGATFPETEFSLKFKAQYAVYGAFTVQAPIGPIYLNMKFGGGYQNVTVNSDEVSSPFFGGFKSTGHFGPMFGSALIYPVQDWTLAVRYDRFSGKNNHEKSEYIVPKNVISFQVGYHF